MELGYALSSEEHRPLDLVRHAREAERAGFSFALVSDHFLIRTHPAIVAHAAATAAAMLPGRFFLGVGTGENLNEHVLGDRWPQDEVLPEVASSRGKVAA